MMYTQSKQRGNYNERVTSQKRTERTKNINDKHKSTPLPEKLDKNKRTKHNQNIHNSL